MGFWEGAVPYEQGFWEGEVPYAQGFPWVFIEGAVVVLEEISTVLKKNSVVLVVFTRFSWVFHSL